MGRWSLSRTGSTGYRRYLRTRAWNWRRQRWFRDRRRAGFEPACQVCDKSLEAVGTVDLHHVSYDGVVELPDGRWQAREADEDLMPLCRDHHGRLHRMMDRRGEFVGWNRRRATVVIVAHLRREWLARQERAQSGAERER